MSAKGYYIMHCIDGDECLVAHVQTWAEAVARWKVEHAAMPHADLSIWEAGGRMVAVTGPSGELMQVQP